MTRLVAAESYASLVAADEWPLNDGSPALQEAYAAAMEDVAASFPLDGHIQANLTLTTTLA